MQRFYLFGGMHMYPFGGVADFQMSVQANTVDVARGLMDFSGCEWWQIATIEDGVIRVQASGYHDKESELEGMS